MGFGSRGEGTTVSIVSVSFFLFCASVFAVYWLARGSRAQNWVLLVASYGFYALFDWRFCSLLLAVSFVGYRIGRRLGGEAEDRSRRRLLALGITSSLAILGVFKYLDFFAASAASLAKALGLGVLMPTLSLALPVGISFYLFKIISYIIDVYRDRSAACTAPVNFLVYVAFFPQILSGPVDRASNLLPQLGRERHFEYPLAAEGTRQLLWGLFKKIALADALAVVVREIMGGWASRQGPELAFGMVLYSVQIYCDFSGYSDISIGLSKLLGLRPIRNFAYPYFSQNVAEFWRRWNISVSSWFRDYVYIPLGGSRVSHRRLAVIILVTFLLSGLWHGANVTYLAWGGMLGVGVAFTSLRGRPVLKATDTPGGERTSLRAVGRMLVTFAFITLSWVFFQSQSMHEALGIFSRILTPTLDYHAWIAPLRWVFEVKIPGLAFAGFAILEWLQRRRECALEITLRSRLLRWALYSGIVWVTLRLYSPGQGGSFIYFRY